MAHSRLDAAGSPGSPRSRYLARHLQETGNGVPQVDLFRTPEAYLYLVDQWQHITRGETWIGSNRCCRRADAHGVPECCYQLTDGSGELTFTYEECRVLRLLHGTDGQDFQITPSTGMYTYVGEMTEEEHRECLRDGWMADTLECASHPLRPILGEHNTVLGTVAIDGCNTPLEFERYSDNRDEIAALWQVTVDLFGVKNYYCNHWIKQGWYVL